MRNDREYSIELFDYYGDLLTEHQKEILKEYYYEDLSMNEIAENYDISKSAVQDLIKRSLMQLNDYEKALSLIEKDHHLDQILDEMRNENSELLNKFVAKIEEIK